MAGVDTLALDAPTAAIAGGDWQPLFPGAEVMTTNDGLTAVRHAPAAVDYTIVFEPAPERGRSVGEWLDAADAAKVAVNCGFYWEKAGIYRHLGLLMANGERLAPLRSGWGGVFIVRDGASSITPKPRRLRAPATLGLQGWPVLVAEGRATSGLDAGDYDRRTAVGIDRAGRVVWVTAPLGMTLAAWAKRLTRPDIGLTHAVNLDGGSSTGLRWRADVGGPQSGSNSLPVPCAILLQPLRLEG